MLISVVVPCYNEEEVLGQTHRSLSAALERLGGFTFEIVYVDDGSRDATPETSPRAKLKTKLPDRSRRPDLFNSLPPEIF